MNTKLKSLLVSGLVIGVLGFPPGARSQDEWPIITAENIDQLTEVQTLELGSKADVFEVAFSPDGTKLAVSYEAELSFVLWDIADSKQVFSLTNRFVRSMSFDATDTALVITSISLDSDEVGGVVEVLDMDDMTVAATFDLAPALGAYFNPDGTLIAITALDGRVLLWDWSSDEIVAEFSIGEERIFWRAAFSPNGELLAAGTAGDPSIGAVYVWEIASGELLSTFEGHSNEILNVDFINDDVLVSADDDGDMFMWDLVTATPLTQLVGYNFAYSPNGEILAMAASNDIQFWSAAGITGFRSLADEGQIYSVAFNAAGTMFASTTSNTETGVVRLWAVVE